MHAGGTAGVAAWLSVYPLDVLKARMQAIPAAQAQHAGEQPCLLRLMASEIPAAGQRSCHGLYASAALFWTWRQTLQHSPARAAKLTSASAAGWWGCAREVVRQQGIAGLFRGLTPTLLRAWVINAVLFSVYEPVEAYLKEL